jgi:threonyl-tRNA synthetase
MDVPRLPTWLSPTQVRLIPVGNEHLAFCDEVADRFEARGLRADVDDRDESVGKRIATAETDWVPYYAVVGDRELESGELGVNVRGEDDEVELTPDALLETVDDEVGDLPRRPRYLPRHVGDHPNFTGR